MKPEPKSYIRVNIYGFFFELFVNPDLAAREHVNTNIFRGQLPNVFKKPGYIAVVALPTNVHATYLDKHF